MELIGSLFIGKPLSILAVALVFLAGYLATRFTGLGGERAVTPLLIASVGWGLYAAWEWLIQVRTPEADMRVDVLVIWPVMAILSAWALYRTLR